jgi:hypothetical protein
MTHNDRDDPDFEWVTGEFHARERESEAAADRMFDERGYADPVDFLREAGESLFGERWKTEIARDLEVTDRTVRNWSAGKFEIPDGVVSDILALLEAREAEIARVRSGGRRMLERIEPPPESSSRAPTPAT